MNHAVNLPAIKDISQARHAEAGEAQKPSSVLDLVSSPLIERGDRVTTMLLARKRVRPDQIERAWHKMQEHGKYETLWRALADEPDVDRDMVYAEAATIYGFRHERISRPGAVAFLKANTELFDPEQWQLLRKLHVVPVAWDAMPSGQERLVLVSADPTSGQVRKQLRQAVLQAYDLRYTPEKDIRALLEVMAPADNPYLDRYEHTAAHAPAVISERGDDAVIDQEKLSEEMRNSTLINLFEGMLLEAVRAGASDIHVYPNARSHIVIDFRIDGELSRWHLEEHMAPEAFLAVVKDNVTNVDRFERDDAQDGFIEREIDETLIRFRVSILPLAGNSRADHAESVVIRVLDDRKVIADLRQLGMDEKALAHFNHAITQPYGMVIVTGPTGSGKSTTLYAALHQVTTPAVNVLTVEDPVEYLIPDVRQIKLGDKLHLEKALRAILRHDPDVVMVGEMRDQPTAELAIKLANTGHLTFSTLHTNDAPSAVSRLFKMGIDPFLVAHATNLIMAQRLIRTLCPACKIAELHPEADVLQRYGFTEEEVRSTTFYRPGGDPYCGECGGAGYRGRQAVTEVMPFTEAVQHMIVEQGTRIDEMALRDLAVKEGMQTLLEAAKAVVMAGQTSLVEMIHTVKA